MKKSLSFLALAAAATVLLSVPSAAKAQVAFGGTFRGPHGTFSIGAGPFVPEVGAYVPSPYDEEIYQTDNGYGFNYDSEWIPCERYGSRWVIVERPVVYGRGYGYARPYRNYGYGHVRPYRNYGYGYVRPYRNYGYGYARPYHNQGRVFGFDGRRDRGSRFDGDRRWDGRRSWDRRW